ncbi:unnamed protein product, partial [Iphiclides podalirius]
MSERGSGNPPTRTGPAQWVMVHTPHMMVDKVARPLVPGGSGCKTDVDGRQSSKMGLPAICPIAGWNHYGYATPDCSSYYWHIPPASRESQAPAAIPAPHVLTCHSCGTCRGGGEGGMGSGQARAAIKSSVPGVVASAERSLRPPALQVENNTVAVANTVPTSGSYRLYLQTSAQTNTQKPKPNINSTYMRFASWNVRTMRTGFPNTCGSLDCAQDLRKTYNIDSKGSTSISRPYKRPESKTKGLCGRLTTLFSGGARVLQRTVSMV